MEIINGKGIYTFIEGIEYIGEFKNNMKNGNGICTFNNGNIYTGLFKEDKWMESVK